MIAVSLADFELKKCPQTIVTCALLRLCIMCKDQAVGNKQTTDKDKKNYYRQVLKSPHLSKRRAKFSSVTKKPGRVIAEAKVIQFSKNFLIFLKKNSILLTLQYNIV